MRPEKIFEFDAAEYAQRAAAHSTSHLQQQELVKIRQCMKADFAVNADTVGAIAENAILTEGLAFIPPLYASREGYIAEKKLKLIQTKLTKRGVKLHEPNERNQDAAALRLLTEHIAGEGASEAAVSDSMPKDAVQHVTTQMIADRIAQQKIAETTDAPPASESCSRTTLPK
jgi:hypothetical protein